MLLRHSISSTKRFFKKTIRNFKSLFSNSEAETYKKLPKTSPYSPYSLTTTTSIDMNPQQTSSQDHEKLYTHRFIDNGSTKKTNDKKKKITISTPTNHKGKTKEGDSYSGERKLLVARKLKELEMMDMSNVDHVLDIEEVLHYHSRLTCPTYLDIVDKFSMDVYAEILGTSDSIRRVNSRPKYRPVTVRC